MPKKIEFDGEVHEFPDDFTDADIAKALDGSKPATASGLPPLPGTPEHEKFKADAARKPREPGFLESAGEFIDDVTKPFRAAAGTGLKGLGAGAELAAAGTTGTVASAENLLDAAGGKFIPGVRTPGQNDAERFRERREAHTYQPRTEGGKEVAQSPGLKAAGNFVEKGGRQFAEATGSEAGGELFKDAFVTATGGKPIADVAKGGMKAVAAAERAPAKPVTSKISETPVESLRAAGIKVRPSDVKGVKPTAKNMVASAVESLAGPESASKSFSLKNQPRLTRMGLDDIGAPKSAVAITPSVLGEARRPHLKTYKQAGDTAGEFEPTPDYHAEMDGIAEKPGVSPKARREIRKDLAQYRYETAKGSDVVKTISALRSKARIASKSADVDMRSRGDAYMDAANALENELDRQVSAKGSPELTAEFQDARQALAKINDVEESTRGGQLDAEALKSRRDRGAKLSGNLAIIADAAEHAPGVTRHSIDVAAAPSEEMNLFRKPVAALANKVLKSGLYQRTLGKQAPSLGHGEGLSDYFNAPRPEPAPKAAPVVPEPEPAPNYVPRGPLELSIADDFTPGGVPFEGTAPNPRAAAMAGDLELVGEPGGRFQPPQGPRAEKLASGVDLNDLFEASPEGPFAHIGTPFRDPGALGQYFAPDQMREAGQYLQGEKALTADAPEGLPFNPDEFSPPPSGAPATPPVGGPGLNMAADLGIEVVPSQTRRGAFEVRTGGEKTGVAFPDEASARQAALELADLLLGEAPAQPAPVRAPVANVPNPQGLPPNAFDELFAEGNLENNASGESAASLEAINRVASEKAAGQDRFLINPDGSVVPLTGVDSVDAVARPGQVIAQRGIGANPYTVLDRGGLTRRAAENRINMVKDLLGGE